MSVRVRFVFLLSLFVSTARVAAAQHEQHQPQPRTPEESQAHQDVAQPLGIALTREGSGTAWLPDSSPMHALHRQAGPWDLMLHGNLFIEYINERGARGDDDFGSINWVMGMAQRPLAGGPLTLRGMFSIEPLTLGACGYPTLLATGEFCDDEPLHDRQHPHDLFMELAAEYKRQLNPSLAYQLYGAIAGEPALGPVAYPHRPSAASNPFAPISHHWLDSTHISYSVLTGGVFGRRWKAEGSLFNGREPDQNRYDLDFDALDSFSGRIWLLPNDRWALQFSAGHLNDGELAHVGGERIDVDRMTASATYQSHTAERVCGVTIAWGRNSEGGIGTNAVLAESSVALNSANVVFGRAEVSEKTGENLSISEFAHDTFVLSKAQVGYERRLAAFSSLVSSIGASVSVSVVPESLAPFYGGRTSAGFAVFVNLRPAEMSHDTGHQNMGHNMSSHP
jgi:hypothetical protein